VFRVPRSLRIALLALLLVASCLSSSAQLETRKNTRLSAETYAVAVGDFNGDGLLDAAVITLFSSNNLAILIGKGDGTFKPPIYYTVGVVAGNSIVAADLRHNGNLDLVLGESLTENVYVLLGNGDGTFDQAVAYPTLGRPFVAGVGDFNRDGKLDIWTLSDGSAKCGCVEVLLGNGDGTFGAAIPTPTATSAFAAAAGDFNQDGNLDLVASETFGGSQIEILLGKGDGTFRHGKKYLTPSPPQSIAVGHFVAGNKNLDLALAEPEGGAVVILLGQGGGTFRQGQIIPESFPGSITTGDFNGDGKNRFAHGDRVQREFCDHLSRQRRRNVSVGRQLSVAE
jgi:FG-GAP-like repeat